VDRRRIFAAARQNTLWSRVVVGTWTKGPPYISWRPLSPASSPTLGGFLDPQPPPVDRHRRALSRSAAASSSPARSTAPPRRRPRPERRRAVVPCCEPHPDPPTHAGMQAGGRRPCRACTDETVALNLDLKFDYSILLFNLRALICL